MSDTASKMHQDPSSCHVPTGAWGKTSSDAKVCVPLTRRNQTSSHNTVSSAKPDRNIGNMHLLTSICKPFSNDSAIKCPRNRKKYGTRQMIRITSTMMIFVLLSAVSQAAQDDDHAPEPKLRMKNKKYFNAIKPAYIALINDRKHELRQITFEMIVEEIRKAPEDYGIHVGFAKVFADLKGVFKQAEYVMETRNKLMDTSIKDEVKMQMNEIAVAVMKSGNYQDFEKQTSALLKDNDLSDYDIFRPGVIIAEPFEVLKTRRNNPGDSPKTRNFHFNTFNNVETKEKEMLRKLLREHGMTDESPVICYNKRECLILVSDLKRLTEESDEKFPKGPKRVQYKDGCYKVSGTFFEYSKDGFFSKKSWKMKDDTADTDFLHFWIPKSSNIKGTDLLAHYQQIETPVPKAVCRRLLAAGCGFETTTDSLKGSFSKLKKNL